MIPVTVSFRNGLDWFLSADRREGPVQLDLVDPTSLKDLVESLGVPHPELRALTRNGAPATLTDGVAAGDSVVAWGYDGTLADGAEDGLLRPALAEPRFVLDVHLGKLARYLRLLGLDTHYSPPWDDHLLAAVSERENRVMLTRDVGLLKRANITYGMYVRTTESIAQAREVLARYHLRRSVSLYSRCLSCNGELALVEKADVLDRLPPRSIPMIDRVFECDGCAQLFWRGSHLSRLQRIVQAIVAE